MMKIIQMIVVGSMLAMLPFNAMAQRGSGNWCATNNYSRLFDASAIKDLNGSVVSIEKITPEKGMSTGIHLLVKTEKNETISVHLGPSWYLDNQDVQFVAGDVIKVKGSSITYQNAPAIIAMTVEKGGQVLVLRDKKGNPNWNGWRSGKGGRKNRMNN
ncbi:MAG: DNA-binding protein [Saprospiraceae bacterium]|nr:DNA-binding protein [Saprospiraceae bacterium]